MHKPTAAIAEDERRSERTDVDIAAGLRTSRGKRVPALIRNVSAHGFMAECGAALVPGTAVTLDLFDGTALAARVAWRREGHIGAAFVDPISDEMLAAIA